MRRAVHWGDRNDPDGIEPVDDLKPPARPMPTRAWVSPLDRDDSDANEFHCLVEEFPGEHYEHWGTRHELLRWAALDRDAQDFFVWNVVQQGWDRPSRAEVLEGIQSPPFPG